MKEMFYLLSWKRYRYGAYCNVRHRWFWGPEYEGIMDDFGNLRVRSD